MTSSFEYEFDVGDIVRVREDLPIDRRVTAVVFRHTGTMSFVVYGTELAHVGGSYREYTGESIERVEVKR